MFTKLNLNFVYESCTYSVDNLKGNYTTGEWLILQVSYWQSGNKAGTQKSVDIIVDEEARERKMCTTVDRGDTEEDFTPSLIRKKRVIQEAPELMTVSINDLSPFADLEASVQVINAVEAGSPSAPIEFETEEGGQRSPSVSLLAEIILLILI